MPLLPFALASPGQQHDDVIPAALLALALILVGAKLAGEIFERFGQPAVLGELCAGILLGNLALVGGPTFESISQGETFLFLSELGAILLLFHVGLESTPREMMAVGGRATLVALAGVVAPMALGYGVGRVLRPDDSWMVHVSLGAMLCATSVGITARPSPRASRAWPWAWG